MEKQYALGIDQKNKEPYCIPMNLENIDQVFTDYSKEDILKKVNEFDSVMKETDISLLGIKVFYKNKWRNDHQVPIVTDPVILSYSVPKLFEKFSKKEGILKDLSNHLEKYIKQENVREIFKMTIKNRLFLENWDNLNYEERRIIRVYLANKYDIKKILHIQEESKDSIEVLEMPEEKTMENVPVLTRMKHKDNEAA